MYRLDIEALDVDTFEPVPAPAPQPGEPQLGDPNYIVWTGCMSECTECGMLKAGF